CGCEPACGFEPAPCGCASAAPMMAPAPMAAPATSAPMPPAPIVDPSARLTHKQRVIQASAVYTR
ncbi:MAG: hypothetical protein AAF664_19615, partial [Planctomycetota bacterium]